MNTYGITGDFFNNKAAEYSAAADQSHALGLQEEANILRGKAAHCCELFAQFRTLEDARRKKGIKERIRNAGPNDR